MPTQGCQPVFLSPAPWTVRERHLDKASINAELQVGSGKMPAVRQPQDFHKLSPPHISLHDGDESFNMGGT